MTRPAATRSGAPGAQASTQVVGPDTVLVGVDGSDTSWSALRWAAAEVALHGGELAVCHVTATVHDFPDRSPQQAMAQAAVTDHLLHRAAHDVAGHTGGRRVVALASRGNVALTLILLASRARLLVVAAHGRTSGTNRLLGATALTVAADAICPVVVVRPQSGPAGPFAGHVVVGHDGSPAAGVALAFAFDYARAHRRPLVAVSAARGVAADFWYDDRMLETHLVAPSPDLEELAIAIEPLARRYPEVPVKRAAFRGGAAAALLRAAAGAHLLVVGDRDRRRAATDMLGSTSQAAVALATCPVAVARPPHRDAPPAGR